MQALLYMTRSVITVNMGTQADSLNPQSGAGDTQNVFTFTTENILQQMLKFTLVLEIFA